LGFQFDGVKMKICFLAADTASAQLALTQLTRLYGNESLAAAEVVVALGGDGFLLETMHQTLPFAKPIFGMRRGSLGFLLNDFRAEDLPERLRQSKPVTLHPLAMTATTTAGMVTRAIAFNEVSLLRETRQAAKLKLRIDDVERLPELVCDGALVSTPAGSTAYNFSAHGPILPLLGHVLALTPISAFRPRRWRGAVLPMTARISFEVLEADKRPVSTVADSLEIRNVAFIEVKQDNTLSTTLLFDPDENLEERITREQFIG
jgi:NAD+ kinase